MVRQNYEITGFSGPPIRTSVMVTMKIGPLLAYIRLVTPDRSLSQRTKTRSAELRINTLSEFGWVAGIYYFDSNEDLVREYTFLANNFSSTMNLNHMPLQNRR